MYPIESMTKASKGKEFTRNGSALPCECLDMRCFKAYQNATIGGSVEFPFLDEDSQGGGVFNEKKEYKGSLDKT